MIDRPPEPTRKLSLAGIILTVLYLGGMFLYALASRSALLDMKPDEFATFLAGVFGPLAFLWLVLGFFQQGAELRHSADALWLQGQELQNSVEQQRNLVEVTREQLALEREFRLAAEEEQERLAKPVLVLKGSGSSTSSHNFRLDFTLTNAGATCTHLKVISGKHNSEESKGTFATHDHIPLAFRYANANKVEDTRLGVQYVDARGRTRLKIFYLERREGSSPFLALTREVDQAVVEE